MYGREMEGNKILLHMYFGLKDYIEGGRGQLSVSWHSNEAMPKYSLGFKVRQKFLEPFILSMSNQPK